MTRKHYLPPLVVLALAGADAGAADTNARDFFSAPDGTTLGILYVPVVRADAFRASTGKVPGTDLQVNALAYRHVWFTEVCGTLCTPQFVVPVSDTHVRPPGAAAEQRQRGVGDPMIGATLFFLNDPATRTFSGLNVMVGLPIGAYDRNAPDASAGQNRWQTHAMLNVTRGVGTRWVLEGTLEAQVYGDNKDYFGQRLAQKPLYRLQAFASYDFTPSTYAALRVYHGRGGALTLGGADLAGTRQRYTQAGLELHSWIDRGNQVVAMLGRDVAADNRFQTSQLLLRFVHVY
jgi:hypothetical protein